MNLVLIEGLMRSGNHMMIDWIKCMCESCFVWGNVSPQLSSGPINPYFKTESVSFKTNTKEEAEVYFFDSQKKSPQASACIFSEALDAALLLKKDYFVVSIEYLIQHNLLFELKQICQEKKINFYHICLIRDFFNWASSYMRLLSHLHNELAEESYIKALFLWSTFAKNWIENKFEFSVLLKYDLFALDQNYRKMTANFLNTNFNYEKDETQMSKPPLGLDTSWSNQFDNSEQLDSLIFKRHINYKIFFMINPPSKEILYLNNKIFDNKFNYNY